MLHAPHAYISSHENLSCEYTLYTLYSILTVVRV